MMPPAFIMMPPAFIMMPPAFINLSSIFQQWIKRKNYTTLWRGKVRYKSDPSQPRWDCQQRWSETSPSLIQTSKWVIIISSEGKSSLWNELATSSLNENYERRSDYYNRLLDPTDRNILQRGADRVGSPRWSLHATEFYLSRSRRWITNRYNL